MQDNHPFLGTHRMICSMVLVIFGLFWYVYILGKYSSSEEPTKNLYKDKALVCTCFRSGGTYVPTPMRSLPLLLDVPA